MKKKVVYKIKYPKKGEEDLVLIRTEDKWYRVLSKKPRYAFYLLTPLTSIAPEYMPEGWETKMYTHFGYTYILSNIDFKIGDIVELQEKEIKLIIPTSFLTTIIQ